MSRGIYYIFSVKHTVTLHRHGTARSDSRVSHQCEPQPLITVEKWVEELGAENKWNYEARYNSQNRGLSMGESYVSDSYESLKDVIKNEKVIWYEKRETINENALNSASGVFKCLAC